MKASLALLLLTAFNMNSFAATEVKISPEYASDCEHRRFSETVNSVKHLEKNETPDEVEISFDTYLYSCSEKRMVQKDISAYQVLAMFNEGINFPWSYVPAYKITNPSNLEGHVVITFKKSVIFKKTNERTFSYHLQSENPRRGYFFWNIHLKYEKDLDATTVQFVK